MIRPGRRRNDNRGMQPIAQMGIAISICEHIRERAGTVAFDVRSDTSGGMEKPRGKFVILWLFFVLLDIP